MICRPVLQFVDQAVSMTGVGKESQGEMLRDLIGQYVRTSFVPRVRADANFRVQTIFSGVNAFATRETAASTSQVGTASLTCSAFEVASVIENIMKDYFRLPYNRTSLQDTVVGILSRVLERYQEKLHEITLGIYSAALVGDPRVVDILRRDPLYAAYRGNATNAQAITQAEFFKEEVAIYYRLLSQLDRLDQGQLLLDPKQWSLIAILGESLVWLLDRVVQLTVDPSSPPSDTQPLIDLSTSTVEVGIRQFADKCLFLLRVEFHCHAFYFLSAMGASDYASRDDTTEAEKFVVDLNKDLCVAEERLRVAFSRPRAALDVIFGTQACLLTTILIRSASSLQNKLINRQGLSRILRNIFALQQNLCNIVSGASLERARQYWEMLKESDGMVTVRDDAGTSPQHVPSLSGLFSTDELQVMRQLQTVFSEAQTRFMSLGRTKPATPSRP